MKKFFLIFLIFLSFNTIFGEILENTTTIESPPPTDLEILQSEKEAELKFLIEQEYVNSNNVTENSSFKKYYIEKLEKNDFDGDEILKNLKQEKINNLNSNEVKFSTSNFSDILIYISLFLNFICLLFIFLLYRKNNY
jgi:hypothetical protein